jgi:hypothetical protein
MNWRIDWLYSQWGEGNTPFSDVQQPSSNQPVKTAIRFSDGQLLIERNGQYFTITGVPVNQ